MVDESCVSRFTAAAIAASMMEEPLYILEVRKKVVLVSTYHREEMVRLAKRLDFTFRTFLTSLFCSPSTVIEPIRRRRIIY